MLHLPRVSGVISVILVVAVDADNPKISTIYVVREMLGFSVVYFDQRLGAAHSKRWLK